MRRTTSHTDQTTATAATGAAGARTDVARAYDALVRAWRRHDELRFDPNRVPELAEARLALDRARATMVATRSA